MAITYPLALPYPHHVADLAWSGEATVGVSVSPFTGQQQVYAHQGQIWRADVTLRALDEALADEWIGWLLSLNGMAGTFLMGDPTRRKPRGSGSGTPVVNGGSQTGQTLNVRGWTPSATNVLRRGDLVQIGSGAAARLHRVLADVSANGSGNATLDLWPRLRETPSDGAALTLRDAVGVFRLADNRMGWSVAVGRIRRLSFSAMEAL